MRRLIRAASTYVKDLEPKCGCRNHAEFFMQLHRFAGCDEEETMSQLLCKSCFKGYLRKLDDILAKGPGECPTCGQVITTPSDLIVRITPIGP